MIAVRLTDPWESRLPDLGLMTFQDAESGEQLFVDTQDQGFGRVLPLSCDARDAGCARF